MSNVPLDRIVTTAGIRLVGAIPASILYELFSVVDELLKESGLTLISADGLVDAAEKLAKAAKGGA